MPLFEGVFFAMFDQQLIGWMNEFRAKTRKKFMAPDEIIALDHSLHEMRLFKSRTEITAMSVSQFKWWLGGINGKTTP